MLFALATDQMRTAEDRAVSEGVATLGELMRRAGSALASEVQRRVPDGSVMVLCGPGNNGGDGWVAAQALHEAGRDVEVLSLRDPEDSPSDAAAAFEAARKAGVEWERFDAGSSHLSGKTAVIDAIFGFGFRGPARGEYVDAIDAVNFADAVVFSADIPSGVDSDSGSVVGPAVRADVTVTFSAYKPGLLIYPGAAYAGEVVVADIGIPAGMLETPGAIELPSPCDLRGMIPVPSPEDHKGSRGRVAVVAGSATYPGAAILAARGALRMGAGYVIVVVPECIVDVIRVSLPNVLVRVVPSSADGSLADADTVMAALADADSVVAGPGLTTAEGVAEVVHALIRDLTVPLVLDADGLNALAEGADALSARRAATILTPHPGEAARLLGSTPTAVQSDRIAAASALAETGAVCLLKGSGTIVVGAGRRALVRAGNAGLARAGSGDVLSGMIATLLSQGLAPFDAAVLGAHLHGRAAEYGTERFTETCFTAADIESFLPDAVRELLGG